MRRVPSVGRQLEIVQSQVTGATRSFLTKSPNPTSKPAVWITPREAAEYLNVGVDIIIRGDYDNWRMSLRTLMVRSDR